MELTDLRVYISAEDISDRVWKISLKLKEKKFFGMAEQLSDAADSIGANISEGYGRFHYGESINFYYYARGSLWETVAWLLKVKRRKLYDEKSCDEIISLLKQLGLQLNNFIAASKKKRFARG